MQKWILNNDIISDSEQNYSGSFYCNGVLYSSIRAKKTKISPQNNDELLAYRIGTTQVKCYNYSSAKNKYIWANNSYRTIIIDETNSTNDFLTFVQANATQVSLYSGLEFQDINIDNVSLKNQYVTLFNAENYDSAFAILNNTDLLSKYLTADKLNQTTTKIVALEQNDDTNFDKFFAYTQTTQPTLSSGQMWWQIQT